MWHDELDKTTATRFTPDSSFQNLFNERLKHIPGKRELVRNYEISVIHLTAIFAIIVVGISAVWRSKQCL